VFSPSELKSQRATEEARDTGYTRRRRGETTCLEQGYSSER
jgi:hypothetical protein